MTRGRKGGATNRPRPLTDLERALLDEGRRQVTVRDGGAPVEMSVNEIIARKTAETAAKGSPHAQRTWFTAIAEAAAREAANKEESAAFWCRYQKEARHILAAAEKQGKPPPEIVPHPDDIVIDHQNNVSVMGAVTSEEARAYDHIAGQRDAFLRQHVLDERRAGRGGKTQCGMQPTSAYLMAAMANAILPTRLQFDEQGMVALHYRYRAQTNRQLLKDNTSAWKRLGHPSRRDAVSPSVEALESNMPALATIAQDLNASAGTDRDIEEALARVVRMAANHPPCLLGDG